MRGRGIRRHDGCVPVSRRSVSSANASTPASRCGPGGHEAARIARGPYPRSGTVRHEVVGRGSDDRDVDAGQLLGLLRERSAPVGQEPGVVRLVRQRAPPLQRVEHEPILPIRAGSSTRSAPYTRIRRARRDPWGLSRADAHRRFGNPAGSFSVTGDGAAHPRARHGSVRRGGRAGEGGSFVRRPATSAPVEAEASGARPSPPAACARPAATGQERLTERNGLKGECEGSAWIRTPC